MICIKPMPCLCGKCVSPPPLRTGRGYPPRDPTPIIALHREGKTLQAIADAVGGLSRERIRQVLKREGITERNGRPTVECKQDGCAARCSSERVNPTGLCREHRRLARLHPRTLRPHGTKAAWARHKFYGEKPCDECREANALETRLRAKYWRQRFQETGDTNGREHGTRFVYTYCGCRCRPCRDANMIGCRPSTKAYNERQKLKRQQQKQQQGEQ